VTALARLLTTSTVRWLIAYCVVFGIAASGVVGYIYWQTNALLTQQLVQTLVAEENGLRDQFELGGVPQLARVIAEHSTRDDGGLYLLGGPDGTKIAGNLSGFPPELSSISNEGGQFRYNRGPPVANATPDRVATGVAIAVPGGYTLVVGRDSENQRDYTSTLRRILLWSLSTITALGLGGGVMAGRGILSRIEGMRATTETIMAGDLSRRVPVTGSADEFDRLAGSLNGMLERIEQLMTGMREVSDNIAHDLRTPLSRLRTRLESALREAKDWGVARDAITGAMDETDGLIKTFNALLNLARLEAGTAGSLTPTDVGLVVTDAAEFYEPVAEEKGVKLTTIIVSGFSVAADRQLLGQAVTNLIDNALKYGAGTGIDLSVRRNGVWGEIAVADRGPGVPAADRERALKRFVRLEPSRSEPGSGLGLSLVAAVARLHGGTVRLEDNNPGLRVVIALPLLAQQNAPPHPARPALVGKWS
jgi:signal transduction histidine kinase